MTQASEVRQDPSRNIMACENEILHSKQGPYRNRITQVPETAFPMSVSHRQARPSFSYPCPELPSEFDAQALDV